MSHRPSRAWFSRSLLAAALLLTALPWAPAPRSEEPSPFEKLAGRWVGEGRFGAKDGNTEAVKCRVTYVFGSGNHHELKQTIRCASAGGNVEVQSTVVHKDGKITGTWKELVRDWSGDVSGSVTPKGFRVNVRGQNLNANMDIIMAGAKQVVEIQFIDSSLIGLTLILDKADSPTKGPS